MPNPENLEQYKLKPGETLPGNGRPKGSKSMKTILREMLELVVDTPKNEIAEQWEKKCNPITKGKMSIKDALVMKDISNAMKGNDRAAQRIWEYLEGKPDQHQVLEVKQPQSKAEIQMELEKYAKRAGLTLQEYCLKEGIDIDQFDEVKKLESGE